jgi:5-deoxy-glucuronate isomerase
VSLQVKGRGEGQTIVEVTPQSAGWRYVGFVAFRLKANESISIEASAREQCFVVLSGTLTIDAGSVCWREIGTRNSVFDDTAPYAAYLPPGHAVTVTAHRDAEFAIASAPSTSSNMMPRLIRPEDMKRSVRGEGSNTRYVCDILPQTEAADSLLVVEVRTPAAHSSSYPPHKHDQDAMPQESALEETYYHRIDPAQGFAFQRVYTDDRSIDESVAAENHDVVMVPRGYHPVVMPHGYQGYYLNVMAGPKRQWQFKNDPAHEWMLKQ